MSTTQHQDANINREKARQKSGFDLHHTVHEAETQNLKPSSPAHRFEVTLEPDTFTEEKFLLYKNYQIKVHHDKPEEVSKAGFKRFLCSSPLHRSVRNRDGEDQKLGSYHHCYRLDGKLIALAVLDLLPHAVSGVYFLYHQEVEQWSFGKMSAMREAALAFEGGYEFYYMGYYIHNCVKMRYKGDYKPQYVLDPETYDWNLLDDDLIQLLNQKKYVSVSRERERARHDLPVKADHPKKDNEQSTESVASEPEFPLPVPNDAVMSGQSLLTLGMPGIPSSEGLTRQTNLDQIQIFIGSGKTMIVKTSVSPTTALVYFGELMESKDLQTWEDGNIEDSSSLKGIVAEFVACVGPDVAKQVILDFSR